MPEREMHRLANKHKITPAEVARKHYNPENLLKHTSLQYRNPADAQKVFDDTKKTNSSQLGSYWDKVYLMTLPTDQIRKQRDYLHSSFPDDVISSELFVKSSETEQERISALNSLVKLADTSNQDVYTCIDAYNALDRLKPLPRFVMEALAKQSGGTEGFGGGYIDRLRQNFGLAVPTKLKKNKRKLPSSLKK